MCEESAKTWTSSASSTTQSSWPFFVVRTRVVRMRMMLLLPLTPTQRAHTLSHTRPSYSHTPSLSLSSVVLPLLSPVIHLRSSSSFLQLLRLRPSSPSAAFRSPPLVLIPSLAHALVMISCEEHHVDRCCSNAATESTRRSTAARLLPSWLMLLLYLELWCEQRRHKTRERDEVETFNEE